MKRDELEQALNAQPFDSEVEVKLGHLRFDPVSVRYDEERGRIVVELFQVGEDPNPGERPHYKVLPKDWGTGNTR